MKTLGWEDKMMNRAEAAAGGREWDKHTKEGAGQKRNREEAAGMEVGCRAKG